MGENAAAGQSPLPATMRDRALVRQTATLLAADLSLAELFERLCDLLATVVDTSVAFVALERADGSVVMEYLHDHGVNRRQPSIVIQAGTRTDQVMRTGRSVLKRTSDDWSDTPRIPINDDRPETEDTVSAVFVPLHVGRDVIGVLSLQSTKPEAYDDDDLELLESIACYLAVAVHNQRLYQRLRRDVETDALTALVSHAGLLVAIDQGLARATDTAPLAAVVVDVTNFGALNDTLGYAKGNAVLQRVAAVLRSFAAPDVTVGRYGGDDFLLVVSGRSRGEVAAIAEAIVARGRQLTVTSNAACLPVTLACGYAFAPDEARTRTDLLSLATYRMRLSRQVGDRAVGGHGEDALRLYGSFEGVETIVESLLLRDPFTRMHLCHVNALANHWGLRLGLDALQQEYFVQASLLHDVGKLLIPDRILMKPAPLTAAEYEVMKLHAEFGERIIGNHPRYAEVARIVGQHHERFDGLGYPRRLPRSEQSELARALAVVDAFSAMVLDRPYHRGIGEEHALHELSRCAGTQFDPFYVESFIELRQAARERVPRSRRTSAR